LKPVPIEQAPKGRSLSDLIEASRCDARHVLPESIRRNLNICGCSPIMSKWKGLLRRTRIYPIMHLVAIKRISTNAIFVATSLTTPRAETDRHEENVQSRAAPQTPG
jgi:hypothetical protein